MPSSGLFMTEAEYKTCWYSVKQSNFFYFVVVVVESPLFWFFAGRYHWYAEKLHTLLLVFYSSHQIPQIKGKGQ